MTLEEKIGQLFIIPIWPSQGDAHIESVHNLLRERHIGGLCFSIGESQKQLEVTQAFEQEQDIPLWTFIDAEWGVGMRLTDVPNLPKNRTLGAIEDLSLLRDFGREVAAQCRSVGIWGNFAPVVDVNSNLKNPVIGKRSFGASPQEVAQRGLAVMEGMREGGILTCAKHFPGHGDTSTDSHYDLPVIQKTLAELEQKELIPFKALIDGGVEMVMIGHLQLPHLSEEPASLSHEIMTELLREKLGFKGLIVTDALNMGALANRYPIEDVFVKTLLAGADLLLTNPIRVEEFPDLIENIIPRAIEQIKKTVPEAIIDEKVERILEAKKRTFPTPPKLHPHLRRTLYRAALHQVGEIQSIGPQLALVQSRPDPEFVRYLSRYTQVETFSFEEIEKAKTYPHLVVSIREGDIPPPLPLSAIVALFTKPEYVFHPSILVGYEDEPEVKEAISDRLCEKLSIQLSERKKERDGREKP